MSTSSASTLFYKRLKLIAHFTKRIDMMLEYFHKYSTHVIKIVSRKEMKFADNIFAGMGLREQFSCLIYLFLGTRLDNFSSDNKFFLPLPNVYLDLISYWTCKLVNPAVGKSFEIGQF